MMSRFTQVVAALVVALSPLAAAADEGRYQLEVGPPVVVLDTETGEVWVGVSHPTETLVLRPARYQTDDTPLSRRPPGASRGD